MTENLVKALEEEVGKCISCGFCESVCPTLPAAGYDLWKGARGRVIMGNEVLKAVKKGDKQSLKISDSFYSCLDCMACLYVCPAGVNAGNVSHISREIITEKMLEGNENPLAGMIASVTMKYMNPLAVKDKCASWFEGMVADSNSSDLLYTGNMYQLMAYTGGMADLRKRLGNTAVKIMSRLVSGMPSLIRISPRKKDNAMEKRMNQSLVNIAELLGKAGISFNYLGKDEPYPGTFIYDLGYREMFKEYAEKVTRIFRESGAKRIITLDPHTYDLLRNAYPQFVKDFDFEVVHYLDLIDGINYRETGENITYHEPCHFSLREDSYNKPLSTLEKMSRVQLPHRSGKRTRCCGGPDELLFPDIAEKAASTRYAELENVGAEKIVTACPICFVNLNRGPNVVEISDYLRDASS